MKKKLENYETWGKMLGGGGEEEESSATVSASTSKAPTKSKFKPNMSKFKNVIDIDAGTPDQLKYDVGARLGFTGGVGTNHNYRG